MYQVVSMHSDRNRLGLWGRFHHLTRGALLAVAMAAAAAPAAHAAEPWEQIDCSDAGYAGRRAFTCGASAWADAPFIVRMSIRAWANPEMQLRAKVSLYKIAIRPGPNDDLPADPIVLKGDGRSIRQYAPADLAEVDIDDWNFSAVLPLTEAQLNELASAQEISIEATSSAGQPVVARLPGRRTLGELTAKARAGFQAYHVEKRKFPRRADDPSVGELWGPLGEAADRSEFWINRESWGVYLLELKWAEQDKVLRLRHTKCRDRTGSCEAGPQWTARVNPNAAINGTSATVLDFHNESGKPVLRATGPRKKGSIAEEEHFALTFDPVLENDLARSFGGGAMVSVFWKRHASGLEYKVGKYFPATLAQVEQAIGKMAAEKRAREREKREQEEAAERADADRAAAAAAEEEEEERQRASRPNLAQVFAGTFVSEMAKNNGQRAQLQASINAGLAQGSRQAAGRTASTATTTSSASQAASSPTSSWSRMSDNTSQATPQKEVSQGKPLKFVLMQSMKPGPKAKNNPTCVSNVITVPGPAGFGSDDWEEAKTGGRKAREIIESYFAEFAQKCRQTIDGALRADLHQSPRYEFNMSASEEQKPQRIYDDYRSGRGSVPEHAFVSMR